MVGSRRPPGTSAFGLANSILDNRDGDNCSDATTLTSGGFNLATDNSCPLLTGGPTTDRILTNLGVGISALDLHGGQTRNAVPFPGSPALDGGASSGLCGGSPTADQRGLARPQNGSPGGTETRCDIGAVEVPNLVVRSQIDALPQAAHRARPARNATSECSLRQAVLDGNAFGGAAITLFQTTFRLTRTGRDEDAALTGDLDVTAPLIIVGVGAEATTIQAGTNATDGIDRIFHVHPVTSLTLRDLTLRFGRAQGAGQAGEGGAVLTRGRLALERVVVRQNSAATDGGGIAASLGRLFVTDSEIRDNTAGANGGGVPVRRGDVHHRLDVRGQRRRQRVRRRPRHHAEHTIVHRPHHVQREPGGRRRGRRHAGTGQQHQPGARELRRQQQHGRRQRGVQVQQRQHGRTRLSVAASLFAANSSPNCQVVGVTDGLSNLSDDATCDIGTETRLNTNPVLGQLRNNGGLTRTHAPAARQPGHRHGSVTLASRPADQRGTVSGVSFAAWLMATTSPARAATSAPSKCNGSSWTVRRMS